MAVNKFPSPLLVPGNYLLLVSEPCPKHAIKTLNGRMLKEVKHNHLRANRVPTQAESAGSNADVVCLRLQCQLLDSIMLTETIPINSVTVHNNYYCTNLVSLI